MENLTQKSDFFRTFTSINDLQLYGFAPGVSKGNVVRFSRRFELSCCLSGITIKNIRQSATTRGYTELLRVLLTWGAVEAFGNLYKIDINRNRNFLSARYEHHLLTQLTSDLRGIGNGHINFMEFVHDQVVSQNKVNIQNYLNNQPFEASYLLSSIRHVFGHGILTPHSGRLSGKTGPTHVIKTCRLLTDFFLHVLDKEFSSAIKQHPNF